MPERVCYNVCGRELYIMKKNVPQWFAKGNIYQINPRTFSPEGDLKSIGKELPFLRELGICAIYLCPIFKEDDSITNWSKRQIASQTNNPKNPYRMNDYFAIDDEYGTMEDLKALIAEAHLLDMKVILDLVYLHIGPNADVLKNYPDFVNRDEMGNMILGPWNFPMLNYSNLGLREYLWCNMTYYIGALNADGFRCDVGDQVPLDFWQEGTRRIRAIKPDAVMINEGVDPQYLTDCFDANYAFAWHEAVYAVLTGEKPADHIRQTHREAAAQLPNGGILLRDLDNHDTVTDWPARAEIAAGHDGVELAIVLNYTIDGVPMLYCGNELADTAKLSMFANRFYMGEFETTDRNKKGEGDSLRRQKVIKKLNQFRSENDVLVHGQTQWIPNSREDKVVSFVRCYAGECILFVGNFSSSECVVDVQMPGYFSGQTLFESMASATNLSPNMMKLPPYAYKVVKL